MPLIAILAGLLLLALGPLAYYGVIFEIEVNTQNKTAFIPSGFGAIFLLCGLLSLSYPPSRKHAMHLTAVVSLFGIVGGFVPMIRAQSKGTGTEDLLASAPVKTGLIMSLVCAGVLYLAVRSFIAARKAREAKNVAS